MNAGDLAVEHKDNEAALREYSAAEQLVQSLQGVDKSRVAEMSFWHAQALVQMGRVDESLPLFKKAFQLHPSWVVMVPRVQKAGLLPNDQKVLDKILAQAPKGANAAKNRKDLRK
jgi:tetratricopeptide (TPR) repeat protein